MNEVLAQSLADALSLDMIISCASMTITAYFWLVKARREQPCLEIHSIHDFSASLRGVPGGDDTKKRLCIWQRESGSFLIANHSTRQNSVLKFDCYVQINGGWMAGSWGYMGEDKPPWNVGPDSTVAISPACFFDVPADYVIPDKLSFRIELITVSGRRFGTQLMVTSSRT